MTLRDLRDRTAEIADAYARLVLIVVLEQLRDQPMADRIEGRPIALRALWSEMDAQWPGIERARQMIEDLAACGLIVVDDSGSRDLVVILAVARPEIERVARESA